MKRQFLQFRKDNEDLGNGPGPQDQEAGNGGGNAQTSGANEQKAASKKKGDAPAGRTGFETSTSTGRNETSTKEALDAQQQQAKK